MSDPIRLSEGSPQPIRRFQAFLRLDQLAILDQEIIRRKAVGHDKGPDGKRVHVNRSLVLRDLIDEKWPPEGEPSGS